MRIQVEGRGSPDSLVEWELALADGVAPTSVTVRDAGGLVEVEQYRHGDTLELTLAKRPQDFVQIQLSVGPVGTQHARTSVSCGPTSATVAGESLPLPPKLLEQRLPVTLDVSHSSRPDYRVATSLGLGNHHEVTLGASEVRGLNVLVGDLGTAKLETNNGRDEVASLGYTSFDMRWVAAETAGVRTAIDSSIGLVSDLAFAVLIVSDFRPQHVTSQVHLRTASLWLELNAHEAWGAHPRLQVAQTLTSRWLGGQITIGDPGEADGLRAWFTLGFSRYVARETLFSLGTLDVGEYLGDLNRGQAEWATSRYHRSTLAALAGEESTPHTRREVALHMMSRGEMAAAFLDEQLRKKGRTLPNFLTQLLSHAREQGARRIPHKSFHTMLVQAIGEGPSDVFWQLLDGATPPATDYGPCFRARPEVYRRYDLGFARPTASHVDATGIEPVITSIDPQGPAAKAGLQAGDRLIAVDGDGTDAKKPVVVRVRRDGQEIQVRYLPLAGEGRGTRYVAKPKIDPGLCPRWEF